MSSGVIEFRERTTGGHVGDQHGLFRIEQLGSLGHEMHAGQHDDVGVHIDRLAGERQAVADDIGDAVEDLRRLIIVREDDGIAALFQFENRLDIILKHHPFGFRDNAADTIIEGRCGYGEVHDRLLIILNMSI